MDHVDLIIMGGYFGEGRRKGISHFLVGAAVPPAAEGNVYVREWMSEIICVWEISVYERVFVVGRGYHTSLNTLWMGDADLRF